MGVLRRIAAVVVAVPALVLGGPALAQGGEDVGLVNQVAGDASYAGAGGGGGKVEAFMRVRAGDRFTVPAGASLRVVYLKGARQETWKGPASFRAGTEASEAVNGTPVVASLPVAVPQKIARVPELLQSARLGGITVRGLPAPKAPLGAREQAQVSEARAVYASLRAQSAEDDVTPELYLFSVLQDLSLYEDLKPVAAEMKRRQPESRELRELADWVDTRAARGGR